MSLGNSYYSLDHSIDLKEIGAYPQGAGMVSKYDLDAPNSAYHLAEYKGRECPFVPDLRYKMQGKAKLTDFLSGCMGPGEHLVMSDRAYEIISKYSIGPSQVFRTQIEHKKQMYDEFCTLHFNYALQKDIRFKDSIFTYAGKVVKEINSFSDYENYLKDKDQFGLTRAKSTHVDKNIFGKFDLFVIGLYDQRKYISERLYEDLLKNKITGVEMKVADNLVMH